MLCLATGDLRAVLLEIARLAQIHAELSAPTVEQTFKVAINNLTTAVSAPQAGGSAAEAEPIPLPTDLLSKDPRGLLLAQLQQLHRFRLAALNDEAARIMVAYGISEEQAADATQQIMAAQAAAATAAAKNTEQASAVRK